MKRIIFLVLLISFFNSAHATHIAGGELFYEYVSVGTAPNTFKYKITMRLFKECNSTSTQQLATENVTIGIYAISNLSLMDSLKLNNDFTTPSVIQNTPGINPCLTGNPSACYQVMTYSNTVDLPITLDGIYFILDSLYKNCLK
jgi:hypothetical protein